MFAFFDYLPKISDGNLIIMFKVITSFHVTYVSHIFFVGTKSPTTPIESLTNEADFFQAVMDERKWEFGGEGIRKYDLARWNKYGEVIYNLYNEMTNWGLVANGAYVPGIEKVPSNIYYKQVTDPEHSDRKVLDIVGIDEYGPGVGRPAGYTVLEYALGWRVLNKETQLYETLDAISWSFRGFINKNNDQLVKPTDPVRYLCPYPAKVITDHRGLIRNYYGY